MSAEEYRRKAEDLVKQAMDTPNALERGRLLGEASFWSVKAEELESGPESDPPQAED